MSNVAPERMPDPLPQTPPTEPVEAQDIDAATEAVEADQPLLGKKHDAPDPVKRSAKHK